MNVTSVLKKTAVVSAVLILTGCATVDMGANLNSANQELRNFTDGNLSLVQTDEQRRAMASKASWKRSSQPPNHPWLRKAVNKPGGTGSAVPTLIEKRSTL